MKTLKALFAISLLVLASPACAQAPQSANGDWRGVAMAGVVKLRVALHLGATSSFDSVDQNAMGLPAHLAASGNHISLVIDKVGVFEGDLSADGKTLSGAFRQGATTTPITFERGVFTAANRPQTPKKPYPYREIEVGYENPARRGVHLAGAITEPDGKGPFPAVVLITGSGAQDRDETLFEHKPFLVLADALTRAGIAVLRVDDRGMGGSTGAGPNDTTADFATDVEAGLAFLRARPEIDPNRIGLIGHSEGGAIAPMVASQDSKVAFVVLWAGPAVPGLDLVVEQTRAASSAAGASPAVAARNASVERKVLEAVAAAPDAASARTAAANAMTEAGARTLNATELQQLSSSWYRYFIGYDPAPALRELKIPVLALFGAKDTQVVAAQNEPAMRALLAGHHDASVVVLPNLNHLLQTAATGAADEYPKIEETIAPVALKTMVDWVAAMAGAP